MILFPAIDLKDGFCVRLVQGDMEDVTIFNADPLEQAQVFQAQGFHWLHLVDLDGALSGETTNHVAIDSIVQNVGIPVQLGGGIRTMEQIEYWLSRGVARVVLGTSALRDPSLVHEACRHFPDQIAVSIDARDGFVAVQGWQETSTLRALELALRFEDSGVSAIVYTDIDRDGVMGGVNIEATADLAFALTTPVIASGGVSSLADLEMLKAEEHAGIEGAIVGRALYDGWIDPAKALFLMDHPLDKSWED